MRSRSGSGVTKGSKTRMRSNSADAILKLPNDTVPREREREEDRDHPPQADGARLLGRAIGQTAAQTRPLGAQPPQPIAQRRRANSASVAVTVEQESHVQELLEMTRGKVQELSGTIGMDSPHGEVEPIIKWMVANMPSDMSKRLIDGGEVASGISRVFTQVAEALYKTYEVSKAGITSNDIVLHLTELYQQTKNYDVRRYEAARKAANEMKARLDASEPHNNRFLFQDEASYNIEMFRKNWELLHTRIGQLNPETEIRQIKTRIREILTQKAQNVVDAYRMTASATNNLDDDLAARMVTMITDAALKQEPNAASNNLDELETTALQILQEINKDQPDVLIGVVDLDTGNGLSGATRLPEDDKTGARKSKNIYLNVGEIRRKVRKNSETFNNNTINPMYELGTLFHEYSHAFGHDNDKNRGAYRNLDKQGGHATPREVYDSEHPERWFNDPDMVAAVMIVLLTD